MDITERNYFKVLLHLSDGKQHWDYAEGFSEGKYYKACKELKQLGYIFFVSISTGIATQIKDAGKGLLEEYFQKIKNSEAVSISTLDEYEKKFILYIGDKQKYADYEKDILDYYDELYENFFFCGCINIEKSIEGLVELSRKGKNLYNQLEEDIMIKEKEGNDYSNFSDLDWQILNILVSRGDKVEDIYAEYEEMKLYTREEILNSSVKLQNVGLISFFYDENDDKACFHHFIEQQGIVVYREHLKNRKEDSFVIFERANSNGEIIQKKISAREIGDIIRKYKKENVMRKNEWYKILSEITGLSETTFKGYL